LAVVKSVGALVGFKNGASRHRSLAQWAFICMIPSIDIFDVYVQHLAATSRHIHKPSDAFRVSSMHQAAIWM